MAVHDAPEYARVPNLKNRTDDTTEQAVINYAIEYPAHGQQRTSNELRKQGIFISGSGVRSVWLRHDLENFKKRLKAFAYFGDCDRLFRDNPITSVSRL